MSLKLVPEPADRTEEQELRRLVERAERGDQTVLPELRHLLDETQLWKRYGDLAAHCLEALAGLVAGDNLVLRESVLRKAADLQVELAPNGPLERLLCERLTACWVVANYSDTVFGQLREDRAHRAEQLRRRQDSAHKRFLEAVKCFATVRKFLGPVNGGGRKCRAQTPSGGARR
jgi:hypothetical protein